MRFIPVSEFEKDEPRFIPISEFEAPDTGAETARLAARYPAPEQPGLIARASSALPKPVDFLGIGSGKPLGAPRAQEPAKEQPKAKPYRDRREALDDAVNLLEEGANQNAVAESFGKAGIKFDEIVAYGQGRGSEYFKQQTAPTVDAETQRLAQRFPAPVVGEIKSLRNEENFPGADVALAGAKGVVSGFKMLMSAGGAGGRPSSIAEKALSTADLYLEGLRSAAAVKDDERIGRIMEEAKDGTWADQVVAAAKAAGVAPASLVAQGLGTSVPVILASLLPGVRESTVARLTAQIGLGAAQGAGATKEAIYSAVKDDMLRAGVSKFEAEERAVAAQSYLGQNKDQIALGMAFGALASSMGVENIVPIKQVSNVLARSGVSGAVASAKQNVIGRGLIGGGAEALPEFAQGSAEQVAQNIALQREGRDVPTFQGAVGQGTLGAIAGFGAGGLASAAFGRPVTAEDEIARAIEENTAAAQWIAPSTELAVDRLSPYSAGPSVLQAGEVPIPQAPTSLQLGQAFLAPADTTAINQAGSVDEAIAAAQTAAGEVGPTPGLTELPPIAALPTLELPPLPQVPALPTPAAPVVDELGRIEPTLEPLAGQLPVSELGRVEPTLGQIPETPLPGMATPAAPTIETPALPRLTERASDETLLNRVVGQTSGLTAPRPQRIQGTPVAQLSDDQLTTIAADEAVPAITRRSAAVELQARGAETTAAAAPTLPGVELQARSAETTLAAPAAPTIEADAELPGQPSPAMGQPMAQGGTAPALGGVAPGASELAQQPTPGLQQPGTLDTTAGAQAVGLPQPLKLAKTATARNVGKTLTQFKAETGIEAEPYTEPLTEAQQAASALARVMGNTVTFLKAAPGQLPNGFVVPSVNPKDIYIASDADAPVIGVAVHEIAHLLPEPIKAKLDTGLRALFNDNYLAEFAAKRRIDINNTELLDNEIPAYMAQAISERPDFWQDLRAKMGDGDFAEVARVILDKLNTFLAGTDREYGQDFLDRYVTDVAKARDLLSTAYADAMKAQGLKPTQPKGVQRAERIETPAGAGQELDADGRDQAPSYGTGREGAVSVVGRHYSTQPRQTLSGSFYGQGLKGAERTRLDDSPDPRLRQRVYFYVDQGSGVRPEAGVGGQAHEARLNNIYDPKTRLIEPQPNANAFESAVLNAGFDGYIAPFGNNQAAVVLLGPKHKAVPVRALGAVPSAPAPEAAAPTTLRKGLLSREAAEIDTTKIPGARVRMGNLEIPAEQREAANAELKRIGSTVQFSERIDGPVDAAALDNTLKLAQGQVWQRGRDLKMAMQQRVLDAAMAKGLDVTADNAETREYLREIGVRDALSALKQNANAIGWYDLKTRQALAVMALVHPEIAKNQDARFALTWAMAVTSNGLKVNKNFELAEKVYDIYKKTGRMPTDVGIGTAGNAINDSLRLFNELRVSWGMDNLRKFMQTDFTVSEITGISKDLKPGGEHADVTVKGAAILGPKIGNGFFSNLYGNFDSLTMDRWLVRTWGRWTGTLIKPMPEQTAKARDRLTAAVNATAADAAEAKRLGDLVDLPITADTEVDALAVAVQEASMDPEVRAKLNESELGLELRKAGNSLAKYLDGQKEAPQGPTERKFIRAIFGDVLADLQQRPEYSDLTMADLQAVLWYAEKRLYETAKEDPNADEDIEGYSDDDAPDYANAAADVARQKGVSDARIKSALKKEERNERPTGTRPADASGIEVPAAVAAGQPPAAGGFAGREKRQFIGERAVLRARADRTSDGQQSPAFAGDGGKDGGGVRVLKKLGVSYTQKWKASQQTATVFRANDMVLPTFVELAPTLENAQQFEKAIADNKAKHPFGAAVYVYPAQDYRGMKLFLADDGQSGVAVKPDGDIVSVFSTGGAGRAVMELAVSAGGRKLDAFDTVLPEFYAPHGFKAVARTKWNDDFAPDEWSKETFSEFNGGQPDVVFMVYDPAKADAEYSSKDGTTMTGEDGYDKAVARQNREMKKAGKGTIQASERTVDSEAVFEGLDARGLAKARAETALAGRDDADQIRFIQDNFLDILAEAQDSGRIKINCD